MNHGTKEKGFEATPESSMSLALSLRRLQNWWCIFLKKTHYAKNLWFTKENLFFLTHSSHGSTNLVSFTPTFTRTRNSFSSFQVFNNFMKNSLSNFWFNWYCFISIRLIRINHVNLVDTILQNSFCHDCCNNSYMKIFLDNYG